MSTTTAEEPILRVVQSQRFNFVDNSKPARCAFIEPGLVSYAEMGLGYELLTKETIDRCMHTAIGNPLTIGHVALTEDNYNNRENGTVDSLTFNPIDGWYWADVRVCSQNAERRIKGGQRASCAYSVTSYGPGGTWHNVPYEREITGIEFHHLAIVPKGRYEGAHFRMNAVTITNPETQFMFKAKILTLARLFGKRENAAPVEGAAAAEQTPEFDQISGDTTIEVDGKAVRLNDLTSRWKEAQAGVLDGSAMYKCDGIDVSGDDLMTGYRKNMAFEKEAVERENARKNAEAEEAKKKEADERENAVKVAAKKLADDESFRTLQAARNNTVTATGAILTPGSLSDRVSLGQSRYGTAPGKN